MKKSELLNNQHPIALQRLYQQRLTGKPLSTPAEVVAWLGAVQAQDFPGAKWALALRMDAVVDSQMEQAFNDGNILRTHILRPTWHFVTPADIRWMLELTAPRVRTQVSSADRELELDKALLTSSNDCIVKAFQDGQYRTREELGAALSKAGIQAEGRRLGHIVHHAEIEALICSGPRRGNQFTYALLDERAPQAKRLPRDEAQAELTRRYFTSHGPATIKDFGWWSGLTVADIKAGLAMVASELAQFEYEGQTYWASAAMPPAVQPSQQAFLLPTYDEFLVAYVGFFRNRLGGRNPTPGGVFDATLVIGDRVVGSWRRFIEKKKLRIAVEPFAALTDAENAALAKAMQRYADFLKMPLVEDE